MQSKACLSSFRHLVLENHFKTIESVATFNKEVQVSYMFPRRV